MSHYFLSLFFPVPFYSAENQSIVAIVNASIPALRYFLLPFYATEDFSTQTPSLTVTGTCNVIAVKLPSGAVFVIPDVHGYGNIEAISLTADALLAAQDVRGFSNVTALPLLVNALLAAQDVQVLSNVNAVTLYGSAVFAVSEVRGYANAIARGLLGEVAFIAPVHVGGLTALLYEFALNNTAVYVLVAVDGITYALPLNSEVVINLVQRN